MPGAAGDGGAPPGGAVPGGHEAVLIEEILEDFGGHYASTAVFFN